MERVNLSIMTSDEIVAREKDGCDTLIVDWAKQVIFTAKKATDELQPVGEELIGKEGTLNSIERVDFVVKNLVTLVRRLVYHLERRDRGNPVAAAALDYLKRHDLQGNPLREGEG